MKNKIPTFLQERLKMKFSSSQQFPEEIKQFMIEYSLFYDWKLNNNISIIFKVMKTGLSVLDECEYENCENKKMIRRCDGIISKGCCSNHSKKLQI